MKKIILLFFGLITCISSLTADQQLGAISKGTGERISFNKISLIIPKDWNYSKNPRELPGTDQLQLYSDDRKRTLIITMTNQRDDVDFIEAEHSSRFMMLKRALTIPEYKNCSFVGSSQNEMIWERKGIFTKFDLYKDKNHKKDEKMMRIYNYGEQIPQKKAVLLIYAYIMGEEKPDTNTIVNSLQILE